MKTMKKLWNCFLESISPVRLRRCEWCKDLKFFKRVRIWNKIDPAGNVRSVCPKCIEMTCKGGV